MFLCVRVFLFLLSLLFARTFEKICSQRGLELFEKIPCIKKDLEQSQNERAM